MPSSPDPRNRCSARTKRLLHAKAKKPARRAASARQSPQRTHLIEIASLRSPGRRDKHQIWRNGIPVHQAVEAAAFGPDTTRSIFSLIFSGSSQKNNDINWIWSHGGGALTAFADRFLVQAISRPPYAGKVTRATVDGELKRFYYDTAQVANSVTLAAMAQLMPISQIVYGTDFPYRTAADNTKGLIEFFKGDDLKAVDRENVIRLIPRLTRT